MRLGSIILALLFVACSPKTYNNIHGGIASENVYTQLNYTYETYITGQRGYDTKLYLSHFLPNKFKNGGVYFDNNQRVVELKLESSRRKVEKKASFSLKPWNDFKGACISFIRRITPGSLSKKQKPRVLVIGDSVTSGYGSSSNKKESWYPNQYWAFARMLFEKEKIDNGDKPNEYNALFIGSWSGGYYTIDYNGIIRQIRARAEGYGGASLQQLFEPVFGNANKSNPFYDEKSETFSMKSYLSKYRTMDDFGERLVSSRSNPAGEKVKGSDGKEYVIGTEIATQQLLGSVDVCTPSIVVINLCHNTTFENYKGNIGKVVSILRKEIPEAKIVLMTIDEVGTLFPLDYPNYVESEVMFTGLHEKNVKIYNYLRENVENEEAGVYVFAAQFVMPTVEGFPTIESNGMNIKNPDVTGPHYHPNNKVHEAWGYALYSLIKWIIS